MLSPESIRGYAQAAAVSEKKCGSDSASIAREGTVDLSSILLIGSSLI
jgi:hypothetical protein